jgi:hypothetical protein
MKKSGIILLIMITILLSIVGTTSAATLYVDDDGTAQYKTIQSAINNAHSGDVISVKPGIYTGDISISTPGLTVMSNSPYKAVIKAKNNAFNIDESNITIKNFDIRGPGKSSGICFSFGCAEPTNGAFLCTVRNNKISNFQIGVDACFYMHSGSEYILNNDISNCGTGIHAFDLMHRPLTISGNKITNCNNGLYLVDALCTITNNNFNNTVNINCPEGAAGILNTSKTAGKNIIGGPYLGGNYWATPSGKGFSQTHSDTNGDGFAEQPYKLDKYSIDYLPLIPLKIPVAAFSASPISGKSPLKVQFTDKSANGPASWKWSFGDGTYSTSKNPAHKYNKKGKYTVSLTVKNSKGSNTKMVAGYITVK